MSEEKLRLLLAEGHESEQLDYKETSNLTESRDIVELAKDIGAMQVLGGYIVVGADDHGKPTAALTAEMAQLFDESRLRAKMRKYLDEPLVLRSAVHTIEGSQLALVYVGPNPKGLAIFSADGQHGAQQVVFRKGEVFVRHGTASERWQQSDLDRIYEQAIAVRKEQWRKEVTESLREAIERGRRLQGLAAGPAEALDWRLDADTFIGMVTEQFRSGDEIPLRLALDRLMTDAIAFWSIGAHEELSTVLDRFACLGALFIRLDKAAWLYVVLKGLRHIYEAPMAPSPVVRQDASAPLWLAISERLEALGGLAVRREAWSAVAAIALLKTPGTEQHWPYLLRHTVIAAGRGGLLEPQGGRSVQLVSLGSAVARRLACLRPDLPEADERILDSIAQFDALAAIAAIGDSRVRDPQVFYTSFAYYWAYRTEPALRRLISDTDMRAILFPSGDDDLAGALRTLNRWASSEGSRYSGWTGFEDPRIQRFLQEHPLSAEGSGPA